MAPRTPDLAAFQYRDALDAAARPFELARFDPAAKPFSTRAKASDKVRVEALAEDIDKLQDLFYADRRHKLLVVLQGTDTAGKDGTLRGVFAKTSPLGVHTVPWKAPNRDEAAHDYLWRIHHMVPARGEVTIYNRSHYEDVLVVRVDSLVPEEVWSARYDQINAFERHLVDNGTQILKFFLHISREEQAERLRERVTDPAKRWKFSPDDLRKRVQWDDYQRAYEDALQRCTTEHAPWHVIPGDRNWVRNLAVAAIVRAKLEDMDPQFPQPKWDPATIVVE